MTAEQTSCKILVVDDSTSIVSPWKGEVSRFARLVDVVGWFEAQSRLRENPDICVVVVNLSLKHINGLEAVEKIRQKNTQIPIFVLARMEER